MYEQNSVAFKTAIKNKPMRFQVAGQDLDNQVFGKCKTLFLVEAYRHFLTAGEAITSDVLDVLEADCEQLAERAIRDNRNAYSDNQPGGEVTEDVKDHAETEVRSFNNIFKNTNDSVPSFRQASQKQTLLIENLVDARCKNERERSGYLKDLSGISRSEASWRIKQLLQMAK